LSSRYSKKGSSKKTSSSRDHGKLILDYLAKSSKRPLLAGELIRALNIPPQDRRGFSRTLSTLVRKGRIIRIKGKRYALPAKIRLDTGTMKINSEGLGIFTPDDDSQRAMINPSRMKGAMDGDKVVVRVEGHFFRGKPSGTVVRIVERSRTEIVARLLKERAVLFARPYDSAVRGDVIIPPGSEMGASSGQMTVVKITEYPTRNNPAVGEVIEVLDSGDSLQTEIMAVIHTHSLPHRFPEEALEQTRKMTGAVPEGSSRDRQDLRDLPFITIDGASARDFDDAIYAKENADGTIMLYVSIADVSYFVRPETPLDTEARRRGNSVYFPDMVIPMLPERLSNDLCSLNPDVDRLTFTCEVKMDHEGNPIDSKVYTSIIRSRARLTYASVEVYLKEGKSREVTESISSILDTLNGVYERLLKRRMKRDSLDFDFPEPQVSLDSRGHIENVYRAPRYSSHRLVEECMLLANEIVAIRIREAEVNGVFRVHEPPGDDRIEDLKGTLSAIGIGLSQSVSGSPAPFRNILKEARGTPMERFLNTIILRSMKRAVYSEEPDGHFALALEDYTHFTSPIRRYADLLVHRILKGLLGLDAPLKLKNLTDVCEHISFSVTELGGCSKGRPGNDESHAHGRQDRRGVFGSTISGITSFGFFV